MSALLFECSSLRCWGNPQSCFSLLSMAPFPPHHLFWPKFGFFSGFLWFFSGDGGFSSCTHGFWQSLRWWQLELFPVGLLMATSGATFVLGTPGFCSFPRGLTWGEGKDVGGLCSQCPLSFSYIFVPEGVAGYISNPLSLFIRANLCGF